MDDIDQKILDALKQPSNNKRLEALILIGQPAYDRIISRMGPIHGHPQDVDDRLTALTRQIAKLDPFIITNNIRHKASRARSRAVSAAIESESPQFAELIIERLNDPSLYVLDTVIWGIELRTYLRTPMTALLLRKLLASRRSNRLMIKRPALEKIIESIEADYTKPLAGC